MLRTLANETQNCYFDTHLTALKESDMDKTLQCTIMVKSHFVMQVCINFT